MDVQPVEPPTEHNFGDVASVIMTWRHNNGPLMRPSRVHAADDTKTWFTNNSLMYTTSKTSRHQSTMQVEHLQDIITIEEILCVENPDGKQFPFPFIFDTQTS